VSTPQFQPFNNATNIEAAPIMQGAQMQAGMNQGATNAANAQQGQMCSTIGTVAGGVAMAF
jgi:hypothetical protein